MKPDSFGQFFTKTEELPIRQDEIFQVDQLKRLRPFLRENIQELVTPDSAPELFTSLKNSIPTNLTDFYTHIFVPVFSLDILHDTKIDVPGINIELKPDDFKLFNQPDSPAHACWHEYSQTVYLRQNSFSTTGRVMGWLTGVPRSGAAIEEEAAEHELRHAKASKIMWDEGYIKDIPVDEAFARNSTWGYRFRNLTDYYHLLCGFSAKESEDMNRFQSVFTLARIQQKDDFELLQVMDNNNYWGKYIEYDNGRAYDINATAENILQGSLEWLGYDVKNDPVQFLKNKQELPEYQQKKLIELYRWRLNVWKKVASFLSSQDPQFSRRWQRECEIDAGMQELAERQKNI